MTIEILQRWRARRKSANLDSDLEISERRAEAWASRFRALEYAAAAVVILGVVIDDTNWLPSVFGNPEFWSSLKAGRVGGAMIAVGIAFEILFSMLVSGREKTIASVNAQRRIIAEQKTAEALTELGKAQRAIAEANVQAEELGLEIARATERAEHERLERVKLESRLLRRIAFGG